VWIVLASFAHKILIFTSILVLAILLILLSAIGWLGEFPQNLTNVYWTKIVAIYTAHQKQFNWAATILSVVLTAATGALTIYKSWYYAERNLPHRLKDFFELQNNSLLADRKAIFATINDSSPGSQVIEPAIRISRFNLFLANLGFWRSWYLTNELAGNIDTHCSQIDVLKDRLTHLKSRAVTGYVLRGAYFARQASLKNSNADGHGKLNEKAMEEYKSALQIKSADPLALEFAARQAIMMGRDSEAIEFLVRIVSAREASTLEKGRAFRLQAEVLANTNLPEQLETARIKAADAKILINRAVDSQSDKEYELARAELAYGRIQCRRKKFRLSKSALKRAKDLLNDQVAAMRTRGLVDLEIAQLELQELMKEESS